MNNNEILIRIKYAIEATALIIKWDPTNEQIINIINDLKKTEDTLNLKTVRSVVGRHYKKPLRVWVLKGLNVLEADEILSKLIGAFDENYDVILVDEMPDEITIELKEKNKIP
ncbi:hypothetical protein ABEH08_23035 [Pantoea agglomerans]|uniref:hypothetical protein n=1 Tax=Enterobacter agglomerans TaxID=549 RepID=UPI001653F3C1|nr:hypothetical protein [Pantoea agglomerans]